MCTAQIGQFIADAEYNNIRWAVMQKAPGVRLTQTRAFKEAFQKGRKECDDLVDRIHGPAFLTILDHVRNYGIYHQAMNDKMLWDDNATNPNLFDLGEDEERDPHDADDLRFQQEVALNVYIAWPNDGRTYQDWCVNGQSQ